MKEWISVKDRLPAPDQFVLVAITNWDEPKIAYLEEHKLKHANVESIFMWESPMLMSIDWHTVTHWMPLPQLPKEDK